MSLFDGYDIEMIKRKKQSMISIITKEEVDKFFHYGDPDVVWHDGDG